MYLHLQAGTDKMRIKKFVAVETSVDVKNILIRKCLFFNKTSDLLSEVLLRFD